MSMDFDHGPDCGHCQHGCQHPHDEHEPYGLTLSTTSIPCAPGDLMRTGGAYIDRTGFTLASDNWHPVVCAHCGARAMTPIEAIPLFPPPAHDAAGNILSRCGPCKLDVAEGYKPGTGPRRGRRR
jgi:hypothetical protein